MYINEEFYTHLKNKGESFLKLFDNLVFGAKLSLKNAFPIETSENPSFSGLTSVKSILIGFYELLHIALSTLLPTLFTESAKYVLTIVSQEALRVILSFRWKRENLWHSPYQPVRAELQDLKKNTLLEDPFA